ncbi:MAG: septum formation initiator family protein [Lachnospiraceae bacterium]|nr:septum formation initiator family protein [Lachnospiraceae bacterium]
MAAGTLKRRRDHRFGMMLAVLVVLLLVAIVTVKSIELKGKLTGHRAREAELEQRIELQLQRKDEIEEYEKYTRTRKYIEEIAKEKLGLIYEGETIFRNGN